MINTTPRPPGAKAEAGVPASPRGTRLASTNDRAMHARDRIMGELDR